MPYTAVSRTAPRHSLPIYDVIQYAVAVKCMNRVGKIIIQLIKPNFIDGDKPSFHILPGSMGLCHVRRSENYILLRIKEQQYEMKRTVDKFVVSAGLEPGTFSMTQTRMRRPKTNCATRSLLKKALKSEGPCEKF